MNSHWHACKNALTEIYALALKMHTSKLSAIVQVISTPRPTKATKLPHLGEAF